MPTELELKQFLAERMPEKLGYNGDMFFWKETPDYYVKDAEWPYIVSLVEEQVPSESDYFKALENEWFLDPRAIPFNYWLMHLIWQIRTLALKKVLGKKG